MALSLHYLYQETKEQFSLTLLTQDQPLQTSVSWIYLMEDVTNCSFLRGRELVITTGLNIHDPESLFDFVMQVYKHKASGLIFNIGNYIYDIPQSIIDWCQAHHFPIFTMPWDVHITDLTQFFCNSIVKDNNEQVLRSNYLNSILQGSPLDMDISLEAGYLVACYESTLPLYSFWATTFFEGVHYAITVGEPQIIPGLASCVGVSYPFDKIQYPDTKEKLLTAKNEALKALRYAKYKGIALAKAKDLGLYELVLSIQDPALIGRYLHLLDSITEPMTRDILRVYLEVGGSVKEVSEKLFIHRNTVNYHIQKAKLLLGEIDGIYACQYLLAYYFSDFSDQVL